MSYTDPDGEIAWLAPLLWGAAIGGVGYTASVAFSKGGFDNWDWGNFGMSLGIGAISGLGTSQIGQAFGSIGSMGVGGEFARAFAHASTQGFMSAITGGSYLSGFGAGGLGSFGGSAFMMYGGRFANSTLGAYSFSSLAGGVGSELSGGSFMEGSTIGVMNAGLNHLQQQIQLSQMDKLLAKKIAQAAVAERQRNLYNKSVMNDPFGELDSEISYDLTVKGAKRFLKGAPIEIGGQSVSADIYYSPSKNNMVRSFGWPRKQPSAIPVPAGHQIRGYLMYLHNSTNWNVATLRFSNASNYNTFRNYLLGY